MVAIETRPVISLVLRAAWKILVLAACFALMLLTGVVLWYIHH